MSGDVKVYPGLLDAKARTDLRDTFAAAALAGLATRPSVNVWTETRDVCEHAYVVADAMLVARGGTSAEAERQKRLAVIGALIIDERVSNADVTKELEREIQDFVRDFQSAPTDRAPPPEDAPGEANEAPPDATPVFTSSSGDEPAGYTTSMQGRLVGADRGTKDEGESK